MNVLSSYLKRLRKRAVMQCVSHITEFIDIKDSQLKLLDCGCNDGAWTVQFLDRVKNAELYGIEIVKSKAQKARNRGINVFIEDLNEQFPFQDNFFNIVHANQVIEHITNTDNFISEIWRILVPGGCAIICTENLAS